MFSFFKKSVKLTQDDSILGDQPAYTTNDGLTIIDTYKMSLDERKAWRLEMMRKSVYDVLSSLGITSGMYRYRAAAIDDRGHYYAIMIEPTPHFILSEYANTKKLIFIEHELKSKTFENYGVVIDGIYWRATETVDVFEKKTRRHLGLKDIKTKKTIEDLTHSFSDTIPMVYKDEALLDPKFESISPAEAAAFRAALASGIKPPPLHIGGKEYETDLAPLGPK